MLNKGNCDLNIDNEESYNDNLGLISPKDYSLIKVFILLAFFIIIIDFALADYGEWDPCKKIRVGTTKLWIDLGMDYMMRVTREIHICIVPAIVQNNIILILNIHLYLKELKLFITKHAKRN